LLTHVRVKCRAGILRRTVRLQGVTSLPYASTRTHWSGC
jgi:hypothetical protein